MPLLNASFPDYFSGSETTSYFTLGNEIDSSIPRFVAEMLIKLLILLNLIMAKIILNHIELIEAIHAAQVHKGIN